MSKDNLNIDGVEEFFIAELNSKDDQKQLEDDFISVCGFSPEDAKVAALNVLNIDNIIHEVL